MKKIVLIFSLIITISSVIAQENMGISISWKNPEIIKLDSVNSIERLSFENASYKSIKSLPYYNEKLNFINNKAISDYKIQDIKTEELSEKELSVLDKTNTEISNKFKIKFSESKIRKKTYNYIEILPIRLNNSGKAEKLVSVNLMLDFKDFTEKKVSRNSKYSENSKLAEGKWYKVKIKNSGVYQLSYSFIKSLGFDKPENTGVFGYGGMVPKLNSKSRYDDLPERPVYLRDNNNNNIFDSGDALITYLEGPNEHIYNNDKFKHQIHNYSDHAYYFISDNADSKRISSVQSVKNPNKTTNSFDYHYTLEKDSINIMESGRDLYWKHFDYYTEYSFNLPVHEPVAGKNAQITTKLAARSSRVSQFDIKINNKNLKSGYITQVSGAYSTAYAYSITDEYDISDVNKSNSIKINYPKPTTNAEGWLNFITINARSQLKLKDNYLRFRDTGTIGLGNKTEFTVKGVDSNTMIWDITDPVNPFIIQPSQISGNELKFVVSTDSLREFIAIKPGVNFPAPQESGDNRLGIVENQNLHSLSGIDYVIVTNSLFAPYAEQLADFHESLNGFTTAVIDQEKVFNEFSSGTPDISATRDMMKMLYDKAENDQDIPQYLLLFGDGSYDNRTFKTPNTNYILTYQAKNSLSPTGSFVSDDFYGLLDDGEGTVMGSEGLDIGIGRLPVKSQKEAEDVLNKIFTYVNPSSFGPWRNNICFIGDDAEDTNTHEDQANSLGNIIMNKNPVYNVDKLLLDAYEQISTAQGARYPDVNDEIDKTIEKGALLVNYTGHGNEKTLAHEAVVTLSQINSWENMDNLPVFVTATCEFSRFDNYNFTSAGEQILLNPNGGASALFTTTRLVYSGANFNLNKKFYRQVFKSDDNNNPIKLGEIIRKTKNQSNTGTNKRNFSLLGDPALSLAIPDYIVKTDSVNGTDINNYTDTVGAASHIVVHGHIEDRDSNFVSDFNGTLFPKVYDKVMEYTTQGNDDNPPIKFNEQKNILYSGKASVKNGKFRFEFKIPMDIAYYTGNGKISYYAKSENKDAHGYYDEIKIGGSADVEISDNTGPEIDLYMNNTDFVNGGITDENPDMLAFVSDESGINTVGNGIGHDITAVLDDNSSDAIILNDYYESDIDSYTSGSINYPFSKLETGTHSLRLKVWDIFNNSSEEEISFIVANSSELIIEQIGNYPNPFTNETNFTFTHNHADENLKIEIRIYDIRGRHVKTIKEEVYTDGYTISPIKWRGRNDGGARIESGVYIYNIRLQSPNGDVVSKSEKLVFVK